MKSNKHEWQNYGDVNFSEYGGVMIRETDRPDDYEYFRLLFDENGNRYAFHGIITDINDYAERDWLERSSTELGFSDPKAFIKEDPMAAVRELLEGYNIFEFSPSNKDGVGQYSMDIQNFKLTEQELEIFMDSLDIPAKYQPDFEYQLISKYAYRGVEDTYKTNNWSEVTSWSHDKLMNGFFVEIEDVKYGQEAKLDPDRYRDSFDVRNGEFPVDERYLDVDYGDEKEI